MMEKVEKFESTKKETQAPKALKAGNVEHVGKAGEKISAGKTERPEKEDGVYQERLVRHLDELKWLYMELYGNQGFFEDLLKNLSRFYEERKPSLKKLDQAREQQPDWYRKNGMLGMMLYVDQIGRAHV